MKDIVSSLRFEYRLSSLHQISCLIDLVSLCTGADQQVQRSPVFRREGADIHSDLLISVAQAILGGSARSQGLYETLNLPVRKRALAYARKRAHRQKNKVISVVQRRAMF